MKLRIGVVGAGRIAVESHLPVLTSLDKVEVAAICDQRIPLAKEIASKFGVKTVFAELSEMLARENLDVVDICTPPNTHAELSIQAMEAGCHVLVEKPMATSVEDAERMVDSSKRHSAKLCVVHQNLCNPVVLKARRLVESGDLGDLLDVNVKTFERRNSEVLLNQNHWSHTLPGGIFFEILPHPVYLLQSFLKDATPIQVSSQKLGSVKWVQRDELRVLFEAKKGFGSITASCNSLMHGDTLDVIGTQKALTADLWGRTLMTYKPHTESSLSVGKSNVHLALQSIKVIESTASTFLKAIYKPTKVSAHHAFISKFFDSVRNGTKPPATAEDGRQTVKTLETICKQIEIR